VGVKRFVKASKVICKQMRGFVPHAKMFLVQSKVPQFLMQMDLADPLLAGALMGAML